MGSRWEGVIWVLYHTKAEGIRVREESRVVAL